MTAWRGFWIICGLGIGSTVAAGCSDEKADDVSPTTTTTVAPSGVEPATMDLTLDGVTYQVDDAVCERQTPETTVGVAGNYLDQTGVGVIFLYHGPEDQQPYDVIFTLDDIDGQKAFVEGVTVDSLQGRAVSGTVSGTGLLLSDSTRRTEDVEVSWTC